MPDENKKIKILVYGDSSAVSTGFGKVIKGIFKPLAETGKYEITIFGINDRGGWKDPVEHPYKIYPTAGAGSQDIYGFTRLLSILRGRDWEIRPPWDIVFTLNDPFIFEMPLMGYDQGLMHIMKDVLYKLYRDTTKPEFWWKLCCFTPDTQILTENGIKFINEVKKGEKVYTINPVTLKKELQEAEEFYEYDYDGEIFNLKAKSIDFIVTPEHRFFLSSEKLIKKNKFFWMTAEEIDKKNFKSTLSFPRTEDLIEGKKEEFFNLLPYLSKNQELWVYGDINKFIQKFGKVEKEQIVSKSIHNGKHLIGYEEKHLILPLRKYINIIEDISIDFKLRLKQKRKSRCGLPIKFRMEDFISLMGWYISEGYYSNRRLNICQSINSPYSKKIAELLAKMELNYSRDEDRFRISEPILGEIFNKECGKGSHNKRIPDWVFALDTNLLKVLFQSLMDGDGSKNKLYFTVSKKLAEQILQLSLHIGKNAKISIKKENGRNKIYVVNVRKLINNSFYSKHYKWSNYKGKVYCLKVKSNHTVFAGRNGNFQFIGQSYWPVDSPLKGNWVADAVALPDYSVAYTKYGVQEIEKANKSLVKPSEIKNLSYIYHGTDVGDFFEVSPEEKKEFKMKFFKRNNINPDTFIVTCVARNQMRKDIPRTMKIFREFQKRRPDSFLYIHAKNDDAHGSLLEFARSFNLEQGRDWTIPSNFNENIGFPVSALNLIYNASDVVISTSHGEGWGLPITEAMGTKTISLAPNHTSIREIFGTEDSDYEDLGELEKSTTIRGIPIKCGSTTSEWVTYGRDDYERIRPLTNVDDAVKKLIWIYDNPDKTKVIAERAYNWIQQYSWKKIAEEWEKLFMKVYQELEEERKTYDPEKQKQKLQESIDIAEGQKKE